MHYKIEVRPSGKEILRGPDFFCCLSDKDRRTWNRDLSPVVERLEQYHDTVLHAANAIRGVKILMKLCQDIMVDSHGLIDNLWEIGHENPENVKDTLSKLNEMIEKLEIFIKETNENTDDDFNDADDFSYDE